MLDHFKFDCLSSWFKILNFSEDIHSTEGGELLLGDSIHKVT